MSDFPVGTEGLFFDYAATTPVRGEVIEAMADAMRFSWGNPSSTHEIGQTARGLVDQARYHVAALLGAGARDIYFTSGGTEADNLAVISGAEANAQKGNHIITSLAEHHAVLDACHYLEGQGYQVTYLKPDRYGRVDVDQVLSAVRDDTCLVSLMHGNNEVGTLNPISDICCKLNGSGILVHTDAVQTVGKIPFTVQELGVDLLSLSGHKLYGPKGVGALYCKEGLRIRQRQWGGSQEMRIRPGTENVPGIVGLGKACELLYDELEEQFRKFLVLRDRLFKRLQGTKLKWASNSHPLHFLPHIVSLSLAGVGGKSLLASLEKRGMQVSAGSACDADSVSISHVLEAIELPDEFKGATLRVSFGKWTSEAMIDEFVARLEEEILRYSV